MQIWDYAVELSILLFVATAVLLLAASRAGQTPLGRRLALASIATVCGADYAMLKAYNGEPTPTYERAGPIERRVIQRRGQFEYVDKADGNADAGGSGGSGSSTAASGGSGSGGAGDGSGEAAAGSASGQQPRTSMLASLISQAAAAPGTLANRGQVSVGDVVRDCADCPDMVVVAPGYFRMGAVPGDADASSAELPRRLVSMPRWYAIGRSEVTLGQYMAFVRASGRGAPVCVSGPSPTDTAAPVTCVTQADAAAYLDWLRIMTGIVYRLPTESEWEWAARGGVEQRFVSGKDAPAKRPITNAIGMAGLHGGVAERVAGCWTTATTGPARNPAATGRQSVCKFGIVRDAATSEPAEHARLSTRRPSMPDQRVPTIGFRIARDL